MAGRRGRLEPGLARKGAEGKPFSDGGKSILSQREISQRSPRRRPRGRLVLTSSLKVCGVFRFPLARTLPLSCLALVGLLAATAGEFQAAVLIPSGSRPLRWQSVGVASPAPMSTVVTVDPAPAPEPSLITLNSSPRQRLFPKEAVPADALPADASVAGAPIRPPYLIRPSLNGGVPTGFVAGWGDYFLSGSAGTPGNLRDGSPDGSLNLGFGVGDSQEFLGAEVFWGIGSIKNLNANGGFGAAVGRILVNRPELQLGVAGGVIDAYSYGSEGNPQPANGYGAISAVLPLRPSDPDFPRMVQFTLGGGGSSFAGIDTSYQLTESGFYGAAGIELTPNVGMSVGVSGRGTNVNLSWIPFRSLPVFVNVLAADVFDATPWGTIGVLSVGWGDNLKTGFVSK